MRRTSLCLVLVLLAGGSANLNAFAPDEHATNPEEIAALEARIQGAPAREQCFLYAQLIHQMTELTIRQYSSGNTDKANAMLTHIRQIANKLHLSMSDNDKRLKNAEILLRHTAFRLNEMLHASSYEDRPQVEQTLAQVNQVDTEAMMQVLKK